VVLVTVLPVVACLVATAVGEEEYEVPEVDDGFNNVEDLPAGDDTTRMRCQLFGAWGDFCEYRNLCFDTSVSSLLFTVPDDSPRLKAKVLQSSTGIRFTTKLPLFDPSPHRKVPALFMASHKYVPQSVMDSYVDTHNMEHGALHCCSCWVQVALPTLPSCTARPGSWVCVTYMCVRACE
jgi:hypothetical protein